MAARTVLHGIDQSVPSYARLPGKGHWAHEVLTEDLLNRFTYDGNAGLYRPVGQINFLYDFAVEGGAAGDIVLPVKVPAHTIITHGLLDVLVQPTSGGLATVAIEIEAAA
ncbi:MAG: hypothetical protein KJZ78_23985, partial [Bryobacteraceae bacterium]|nr:hypothetical protein [Bryobacteraceae bacterium]